MGRRQTGAKAIPNMSQPARSARWTTWDDRPFTEGVAMAHGMSWWRRLSGTNAGIIATSLGVAPHCGGSERVCPGVSRADRVGWRPPVRNGVS